MADLSTLDPRDMWVVPAHEAGIRSAGAIARFHRELLEEGVVGPLANRLAEAATSALVKRSGLVVKRG